MGKFNTKKFFKPAIKTLLFAAASLSGFYSFADVTINGVGVGTGICANTAVGGSSAGFTNVGSISITENLPGDISTGSITLNAPAGWVFNTSGPMTVGTAGDEIASVNFTSISPSQITISYTVSATAIASDVIVIQNIEMQPLSASSTDGYIYASSSSGIAGITTGSTGTDFGDLSITPVVTPTVTISGTPSGVICAGQNVTFSAVTTDAGTPSYQWLLNSGIVSLTSTFSTSSLTTGDEVTLVLTPSGCVSSPTVTSNTLVMTVNAAPAVQTVSGGGSFCPGGTGVTIDIDGSESGVDYQLYNGATAVGTAMSGTGSGFSFGNQTVTGTYSVLATHAANGCTTAMTGTPDVSNYAAPAVYNVTGGGTVCASNGASIDLDNSETDAVYQLYNGSTAIGVAIAGNGGAISLGIQTVAGTYSVNATNTVTGCMTDMSNTATITLLPAPAAFNITGGGSYCDGGTGLNIDIDNSEADAEYQLYNGTTPVGTAVTGSGTGFSFGTFTASGTYSVVAISTTNSCATNMANTLDIIINPLPTVYTVTGDAAGCSGLSFPIDLDMSDAGFRYQLYNGATAVGSLIDGNGSALGLGSYSDAGTYTVVAIDTTTLCSVAMSGSATITIYPNPVVANVTGGGAYCAGGAGMAVSLDASEANVDYYLYLGGSSTGTFVSGTGSPVTFGPQTAAGDYTVSALDVMHGCTSDMAGMATISINPLPGVYNVTGGGSYCAGSAGISVDLDNSETGVNYQLFVGSTATGTLVAGTGSAISFGNQTAAGTYTVMATNATTSCMSDMMMSALVTITPSVAPSVSLSSTATDTICAGSSITYIATPTNGGTLPSYVWRVNGVNSGTGPTYTYIPVNGDVVRAVLTSNAVCPSPDTATAEMTITVVPMSLPVVSTSINPGDTVCDSTLVTLTASPTFGGASPTYTWLRNGVNVGTGTTFSYFPTDNDVILASMNSNYRCRLVPTVFSMPRIIKVTAPVIPVVVLSVSPSVIVSGGTPVTLTANVTNGGTSPQFQWYKNGSAIAGATSSTYTNNNFHHKDSISVRVDRGDACSFVNFNSVILSVGVGVNDIMFANSDVAVAPNPTSGAFTLTGTIPGFNEREIAVDITNMVGQVVYSRNVTVTNGNLSETIALDNTLANGTYLLSLRSGADKKVTRIVLEH